MKCEFDNLKNKLDTRTTLCLLLTTFDECIKPITRKVENYNAYLEKKNDKTIYIHSNLGIKDFRDEEEVEDWHDRIMDHLNEFLNAFKFEFFVFKDSHYQQIHSLTKTLRYDAEKAKIMWNREQSMLIFGEKCETDRLVNLVNSYLKEFD
jgi:hypothetical protein